MAPVREMLAQKDDNWENWRLNDLTDNLKICGQNFLITSTGDKDQRTIVGGNSWKKNY